MDSFRETAFYLTVWHAFLATLASILLIVLNDFEPTTTLLIAANLALRQSRSRGRDRPLGARPFFTRNQPGGRCRSAACVYDDRVGQRSAGWS